VEQHHTSMHPVTSRAFVLRREHDEECCCGGVALRRSGGGVLWQSARGLLCERGHSFVYFARELTHFVPQTWATRDSARTFSRATESGRRH
jgi:hypothetical protein